MSLHNLAYVLRSRRRFEESEALNREALAIRRRIQDPSHPDLLSTANLALAHNNLAYMLWRTSSSY